MPLTNTQKLAGWLTFAAATASTSLLQAQFTYSGSGDWSTAANWSHSTNGGEIPGTNLDEQAVINGGSTVSASSTHPNVRALRLEGGSGTATLNVSAGASLSFTTSSAWDSSIGRSGASGVVNQTGGSVAINFLELGRDNGTTGEYFLSGGTLELIRGGNGATNGASLILGTADSSAAGGTATGLLEISGGSFLTRAGVWIGGTSGTANATFRVLGTSASEIGIGTSNTGTDGNWVLNDGAVLELKMDPGGVTKILIDDHGNGGNFATFEAGSLLDVDYLNIAAGGTWTVFELENGDITDNGLDFAPGVDTNVWSFAVDNSGTNGIITVTSSDPVLSDAYWEGNVSTAWENPLNWQNDIAAFDESYVHIDGGTVDYTSSSVSSINLRGFRMTDGTFNISADLSATNLSSAYSQLDGIINHTDGLVQINALELGRGTSSNAVYTLSGGELKINRAKNDHSLYLGSNSSFTDSGSGTLEISGGKFTTRTGIKLGDLTDTGTGKFVVLGADASEINIAGANTDSDGFWEQNSGSTLQVGIDFAGSTPIYISDSDTDASGTYATFESGSLLDVGYYNITEGGGSWVVLEVENGPINNNGLSFAPGVDTNIWSFTVDNSGANGRLIITAVGDPLGHDITIGNTQQQQMRYGMDYERLWYWTNSLSGSERDDVARWSAIDTDIDFIRVAVNSAYELDENTYNLSAYTNKIIPLMQEMYEANPNIKFFASPRPLNEAVSNATWQPYPIWITGATSYTSGDYDFDPIKCAQYLIRYLRLMKHYGFQISFLDLTNEWQSNSSGRITQSDARDLVEYMKDYIDNPPAAGSDPTDPTGFYAANYPALASGDMPLTIAPSSWNFSQGGSWIGNLDTQRKRDAIDIAASHNTNRTGSAAAFASQVQTTLGANTEIWNTEVHGWKSTSSTNETTSFGYYLEAVRAGFGGLNGWLAIGTTNQGHAYILNPGGTPNRNVKYHIFQKFSSTSNYGYALDIINEPAAATLADTSDDYDSARNIAAFIKGNLMTVWVINEHSTSVPVVITTSGNTIAGTDVRVSRWTDPSDVEGFNSLLPITSSDSFAATIQGESVYCFEFTLGNETFANQRIEAETFSHQWGTLNQTTGDVDGTENVANTNDGDFIRFGSIALMENSTLSFRVARPSSQPSCLIRVRENDSEGPILGEVSVPATAGWQSYQTVQTTLANTAGIYNLYFEFAEDGTTTGNYLVNLNWFTINEAQGPDAPTGLAATTVSDTQVDLSWSPAVGATGYNVKRSTSSGGPYTTISSNVAGTSFSDTSADSGTLYYYVVSALDGNIEGVDSDQVVAFTQPSPPENLTASNGGPNQIDLSWDVVSGTSSYRIERATTSGGPYTTIANLVSSTTNYSDTSGLTPGTEYYYVISSFINALQGPLSTEASAIPSDPISPGSLVVDTFELLHDENSNQPLNEIDVTIAESDLGVHYYVIGSTSLETGAVWQVVSDVYIGNGGLLVINFDHNYQSHQKYFFRVIAEAD